MSCVINGMKGMADNMNVKFGIMGLGGIAHRFAEVIKTVKGVELTAVASTDDTRSKQFASEYGVKKYFADYAALVADSEVDVVYISQTHNLHYKLIKLCIENKKGVICEKPMVLTERQALSVTNLAKERKVLLMEAMWTRFIPTFIKAKEWVLEGRIGKIKLVQASFCFIFPYDPAHRLYNPNVAGGSLYDAGVYPIEFTTGILGKNPTEVKAVGTLCESGVDDSVSISMKFEDGELASLSCGLCARTKKDGYVYGDNGFIVVYDFIGSHKAELYDKEFKLCETFEAEFDDGFIYEIEHFADLYRSGKIESEIIPHKDNIATSKIFETIINQIHG